jgi:hypothetical protein
MRRYSNGLFLDLVRINRVYLSFKLLGCKTTCGNGLWRTDGLQSITLVIMSLLEITLLDSMELALLKFSWEIDQSIKYFVVGKSFPSSSSS